ncbi:MAG: hypothetical protein QM689_01810 [Oscillospiraceae bacterium]
MKKLTYTGGAPIVLTLMALLFSLISAAHSVIMALVEASVYDIDFSDTKLFGDFYFSVSTYSTDYSVIHAKDDWFYSALSWNTIGYIFLVLSLATLFVLLTSLRKKKTGMQFPAFLLMILLGIGASLGDVIYQVANHGGFDDLFTNPSDLYQSEILLNADIALHSIIPATALLFLLLAAVVLLVRAGTESFSVQTPRCEEAPAPNSTRPDLTTTTGTFTPYDQLLQTPVNNAFTQPHDENRYAPEIPEQPAPESIPAEDTVTEDLSEPVLETVPAQAADVQPDAQPTASSNLAFCPGCGNRVAPEMKFCNNCGKQVR